MKQHINVPVDTVYNVHTILNKYSSMRYSLFNYWSLLFYNKYLYYFFNCFFKKGKKQFAIKLVYFLLYTLKKKTLISPILVLQSALLNYRHILKLNIIKFKRKKIYSYLLLSLNKQVKVSIKYLAKQFASFNLSNNKYSVVERLSIFVLNLFFRTPLIFGRFLQHSANVHKLIDENQHKGRKKKFKKFKKFKFFSRIHRFRIRKGKWKGKGSAYPRWKWLKNKRKWNKENYKWKMNMNKQNKNIKNNKKNLNIQLKGFSSKKIKNNKIHNSSKFKRYENKKKIKFITNKRSLDMRLIGIQDKNKVKQIRTHKTKLKNNKRNLQKQFKAYINKKLNAYKKKHKIETKPNNININKLFIKLKRKKSKIRLKRLLKKFKIAQDKMHLKKEFNAYKKKYKIRVKKKKININRLFNEFKRKKKINLKKKKIKLQSKIKALQVKYNLKNKKQVISFLKYVQSRKKRMRMRRRVLMKKIKRRAFRKYKLRRRAFTLVRIQRKQKIHSTIKRHIRKCLVGSINDPLYKKRFKVKKSKRKITEYVESLRDLHTDLNTDVDFNLVDGIRSNNTFFINSYSSIMARNFFFYLILGKWYKLLEKTYYSLTMPFWHLYNLRLNFIGKGFYTKMLIEEIKPKVENTFIKELITFLNNPKMDQYKKNEIYNRMTFAVDPLLIERYYNLDKKREEALKAQNTDISKMTVFRYPSSNLKQIKKKEKQEQKLKKMLKRRVKRERMYQRSVKSNTQFYTLSYFLKSKSLRTFLRRNLRNSNVLKIKKRLLNLTKNLYMQRLLKITKRSYAPFLNILINMKRYFLLLVRFRLIRLVWLSLRAISLRQTKPLNIKTKRGVATRVFLMKN